ncbi:MAG: chlorophyll synthesis pathway protein BchC [Pseudomonadota bacterium]
MNSTAVLLNQPNEIGLAGLDLKPMGDNDALIDVHWTGISTGTERLLFEGTMPSFPGMGYPLVPGYEAFGEVIDAGSLSGRKTGEMVFVPGSQGFADARGLFGAAASRLMVSGDRVIPAPKGLGEDVVLLALAATAHHILIRTGNASPDLIVGHGVLGRLLARLVVSVGIAAPTVWENDPARRAGSFTYPVIDGKDDDRGDYRCIVDVSGSSELLDTLVSRLAPGGEIILAGFYKGRISFDFPPAFMREARIAIAAEFQPSDVSAVLGLIEAERLSLEGLISNSEPADNAASAYSQAFSDPKCLKMALDWRDMQ